MPAVEFHISRTTRAGRTTKRSATGDNAVEVLREVARRPVLRDVRDHVITDVRTEGLARETVLDVLKVTAGTGLPATDDWDDEIYWENWDEGLSRYDLDDRCLWVDGDRYTVAPCGGQDVIVPVHMLEEDGWQPGTIRLLASSSYSCLENMIGQHGEHHLGLARPGVTVEWGNDDGENHYATYAPLPPGGIPEAAVRWSGSEQLALELDVPGAIPSSVDTWTSFWFDDDELAETRHLLTAARSSR